MVFVAAWHGLCSGYFVSFGIQGLNLTFERYLFAQLQKSLFVKSLERKLGNSTLAIVCNKVFLWCHKLLYTPCVLLGMHTFTHDRYWPIMTSVGAHWILLSYILLPILLTALEHLYKYYLVMCDESVTVKQDPEPLQEKRVPERNGMIGNGSRHKME